MEIYNLLSIILPYDMGFARIKYLLLLIFAHRNWDIIKQITHNGQKSCVFFQFVIRVDLGNMLVEHMKLY